MADLDRAKRIAPLLLPGTGRAALLCRLGDLRGPHSVRRSRRVRLSLCSRERWGLGLRKPTRAAAPLL